MGMWSQSARIGMVVLFGASSLVAPLPSASAQESDAQDFEPNAYASELAQLDIAISGDAFEITSAKRSDYRNGSGEIIDIESQTSAIQIAFFDDTDTPEMTIDTWNTGFGQDMDDFSVVDAATDGDVSYSLASADLNGVTFTSYIQVTQDIVGNVDKMEWIVSRDARFADDVVAAQEAIMVGEEPFLGNVDPADMEIASDSGTGAGEDSNEATPEVTFEAATPDATSDETTVLATPASEEPADLTGGVTPEPTDAPVVSTPEPSEAPVESTPATSQTADSATYQFAMNDVTVEIAPDSPYTIEGPEEGPGFELLPIFAEQSLASVTSFPASVSPADELAAFIDGYTDSAADQTVLYSNSDDESAILVVRANLAWGEEIIVATADTSFADEGVVFMMLNAAPDVIVSQLEIAQRDITVNGETFLGEIDPADVEGWVADGASEDTAVATEAPAEDEATETPSSQAGNPRDNALLPSDEEPTEAATPTAESDNAQNGIVSDTEWQSPQNDITVEWDGDIWGVTEDSVSIDESAGTDRLFLTSNEPEAVLTVDTLPPSELDGNGFAEIWEDDSYLDQVATDAELLDVTSSPSQASALFMFTDDNGDDVLVVATWRPAADGEHSTIVWLMVRVEDAADAVDNLPDQITIDGEPLVLGYTSQDIEELVP